MLAQALRWWRRLWHQDPPGRPADPTAEGPPPQAPPDPPGADRTPDIAGYILVQTLARGGIGELHLALAPHTRATVALKTVRFLGRALGQERFLKESAAALRLHHPHIVRTFAAGVQGEGAQALGWLAMEWVDGHDLGRHTDPRHHLPVHQVLDIAAQVAEGLHHAHRQGVVHRDLKPANILLDRDLRVAKISDFGCARLTDAERSRSGQLIGTLAYMAPEQILGASVDGRCDLYALGVVVMQLLTGRLPFEATAMGELLNQIVSAPAPQLCGLRPDLPPLLSDIVARVLAKQPEQRPADGAHLAREFRLVAVGMASGADAGFPTSKTQ
jgi:serine/threonine-protein kinase